MHQSTVPKHIVNKPFYHHILHSWILQPLRMENAHFPPLPSFLLNSNPGFVRKLEVPGYSRAFEHIPELRSDPAVSRHTWGVVTHDLSHFSSIQSGDWTTNNDSENCKNLSAKLMFASFMFASSLYSWTCSWRCWASAGAHRSTSAWEKLKSQVNVRCVDIASFEASMFVSHHQFWWLQGTFLFNSSRAKAAEQMMEMCGSFAANIPDTTHLRWKCSLHTALRAISSAWNCKFWSSHLDLGLLRWRRDWWWWFVSSIALRFLFSQRPCESDILKSSNWGPAQAQRNLLSVKSSSSGTQSTIGWPPSRKC